MTRSPWLPLFTLLAGCAAGEIDATDSADLPPARVMPTIQAAEAHEREALAQVSSGNGISYGGGRILTGTPTVYFIFYGDWGTITTNSAWNIFQTWAQNIGGTAYYGTNTTYYDTTGNHVWNAVQYGGFWYQKSESHGNSLQQSDIINIVKDTFDNNQLPIDTNALYYVLTASDVSEGKFCSTASDGYCGYHNHASIDGADIKFAFIGDPSRCPASCMPSTNQTVSPNNNVVADAMVNVMSHELDETVSDPDLNAWTNSTSPSENGDKCAWTFGTTFGASNGSKYNVVAGGMKFLIQQNWINVNGGSCTMSYPHGTLEFRDRDSRLFTATGDWNVGSYKSECGHFEAVTGVSEDPATKSAHSVFCGTHSGLVLLGGPSYPHTSCTYVDFTGGDNRRTTATGDWDYGFPKAECGTNEYVAGVSQRTNGFLNGILCCPGRVSHSSCSPRYTWAGDSREDTTSGDWDFGYYKADCGTNRYVAGVARNTRPGQPGGLDAVLCCQ